MTEDQNKEFDLLQLANDMSYANWQTLRYLYNEKFREAEKRNKELEAALDVIASNNGLALSWMSTAPMPLERYKDNCYEMMNIARAALGEKKDG